MEAKVWSRCKEQEENKREKSEAKALAAHPVLRKRQQKWMSDPAGGVAFIPSHTAPGPDAPLHRERVYQQAHILCKASQLSKLEVVYVPCNAAFSFPHAGHAHSAKLAPFK